MILFTFLLYIVIGVVAGIVLGGLIGLLLKVVKRWQQRIKATPLIMACCISIITLLYTGLFIYDRFLPLYPDLPRILINLAFIPLGFILLSTVYMILARITDKIRLIASYLALSLTLYTFMAGGFYINESILTGKFFNPDFVRIITNLSIFISCIIIYMLIYLIFITIGRKYEKAFKFIILKTLIATLIVLVVIGGATHLIGARSTIKEYIVRPIIPTDNRPNIILITMDTTRADHLSCYGYEKGTTPYIDKLAGESVLFKNTYASSPWTLPSHASIFTGMYPAQHNTHWDYESVEARWPTSLGEQYRTLAEILADNGYRTAGVIGAPWCRSALGLAQGFAYYDEALISVLPDLRHFTLFRFLKRWVPLIDIATRQGLNGCRIASQINKRVFSWLEKHYQSPFFLFINYYDPHTPYLPPDQYALLFREDENYQIPELERLKRHLLAQYDGEIAYLDYQMGKLFEKLKELKIYDNTMIIITADHGEFFGEHDCWEHGYELYDEAIRIPLIIKYPSNHLKTGIYKKRVSLVDIMPTILNYLRLPISKENQGVDLFEGESRIMAEVYRHRYRSLIPKYEIKYARELQSLYLGNYKYIKNIKGQGELYDIVDDPRELNNLINIIPREAEKMELKLAEWLPYSESHPAKKGVKLDKATQETLKELGYIQ
jgi:arylsulfatase A-like enzyme